MIIPVILCAGMGQGLWPSSRPAYPRQFVDMTGGQNLFHATLRRVSGPDFAAPVLITNETSRFLVEEQVKQLGLIDGRFILEPGPRGTAPAILTAALSAAETPDALMLVVPSDHLIPDTGAFRQAVQAGAQAARDGALVIFGARPTRAGTGFDCLKLAGPAEAGQPAGLAGYVAASDAGEALQGDYLWNTGLYLFRVGDLISVFEAHAPDLVAPCRQALSEGADDLGFCRLDAGAYESARVSEIVPAVLEPAGHTAVVLLETDWSDLGQWDALHQVLPADEQGVVSMGAVTAVRCENTVLRSEEDNVHLVGLGLKNIAAVATRDAILVADLDQVQDVPQVVASLGGHVPQAVDYPRFHRPWGWYETLCLGTRFQVKRIMVKPGGILSLQSHVHRAEHWVVVAGTARVTVGEEVKLLSENESVYIPLGAVHRMENPGKLPMYLIEVQTGSYLGEDDIVRYEDVYNRT
ncbi:MAG: mannose-1-phosphate guanylyltransferase/mannose-6-phosphate isomerase [Pseudomonadota bacterium]